MKRAILISIKPKWVADILTGRKTIEVRKTAPKCDLPIDVYIYETRDEEPLVFDLSYEKDMDILDKVCNSRGKIVAKFTLNKVEKICFNNASWESDFTPPMEIMDKACLTHNEIENYLNGTGYAWHISDLQIFDKPKNLDDDEFHKIGFDKYYWSDHSHEGYLQWANTLADLIVHKAPQSWQYVEVEE